MSKAFDAIVVGGRDTGSPEEELERHWSGAVRPDDSDIDISGAERAGVTDFAESSPMTSGDGPG